MSLSDRWRSLLGNYSDTTPPQEEGSRAASGAPAAARQAKVSPTLEELGRLIAQERTDGRNQTKKRSRRTGQHPCID